MKNKGKKKERRREGRSERAEQLLLSVLAATLLCSLNGSLLAFNKILSVSLQAAAQKRLLERYCYMRYTYHRQSRAEAVAVHTSSEISTDMELEWAKVGLEMLDNKARI